MHNSLLKASGLALVLGGFALSGHAFALAPLPVAPAASFTIPVVDEEEKAVEEHLNPADQTPAASQDQAAPQTAAPEQAGKGEGSGDVEENELQNMFPSTDWPKK